MTQEKREFFIRLALPVNMIAFAYLLFGKSTSLTAWLILVAFISSQAIYHLLKGPKRSRWINVLFFIAGIMGIFGYVFFSGSINL